jgi:hypothetical protein
LKSMEDIVSTMTDTGISGMMMPSIRKMEQSKKVR